MKKLNKNTVMKIEKYFKKMYAKIWQGEDLNKFDD